MVAQLKIRTRRTYGGDGEVASSDSVYCPRRGKSVATPVCNSCPMGGPRQGDGIECRDPAAHAPVRPANAPCSADEVLAADVMHPEPICVSADLSVEGLAALLLQHGISGVPVVDGHGRPVGMVSKSDLVRFQVERADGGSYELVQTGEGPARILELASATVGEIMMPIAFTLSEHATVAHAAAMMALEDVHRVPIVAVDGKVVGIVTTMDLTRWLATNEGYLHGPDDA
ncbi:MAG: CBS domain-containing protein [Kofleriaceae bacterium]|jgi:CBS domain-containing protein|nr:CBS domain-containing protein [Kofleriaceae bacterium]MBP9204958.1 CBS domain-containing protein [Kofleriaceae bacterium]